MFAEHTVTFPIANRMFGLDSLAKHLNALVNDGQIRDWHPGRWIDWDHTAIPITFDSIEDATLAKTLCLTIPMNEADRVTAHNENRD